MRPQWMTEIAACTQPGRYTVKCHGEIHASPPSARSPAHCAAGDRCAAVPADCAGILRVLASGYAHRQYGHGGPLRRHADDADETRSWIVRVALREKPGFHADSQ